MAPAIPKVLLFPVTELKKLEYRVSPKEVQGKKWKMQHAMMKEERVLLFTLF